MNRRKERESMNNKSELTIAYDRLLLEALERAVSRDVNRTRWTVLQGGWWGVHEGWKEKECIGETWMGFEYMNLNKISLLCSRGKKLFIFLHFIVCSFPYFVIPHCCASSSLPLPRVYLLIFDSRSSARYQDDDCCRWYSRDFVMSMP